MAISDVLVIEDLATVMLVALGMALLFRWIRQPLLIGYILAGMIIGPYTPPFSLIQYPDVLNALADIGIVFLLFAVGLEYPVSRLRSVGRRALVIALVEALSTFGVGFFVGQLFGLGYWDSLFVALAISVTSTVILSSALEDLGVLRTGDTTLVLGITVIEDVVTVTLLGILQSAHQSGHLSVVSLVVSVGLVVLFIALVLVVGPRTISPLIDRVRSSGLSEIFVIALVGLAFGLAIVSSLLNISIATGSFLAGVLVAESNSQAAAHEAMSPLKEVFGTIFFVSMGALMDIWLLPQYLLPIVVFLAVAFGMKLSATYLAARQQRVPADEAKRTALTLSASGGELSIVVAKGGADSAATSPFVLPFIGALTVVTTIVAPYLIRYAWRPVLAAAGRAKGPA